MPNAALRLCSAPGCGVLVPRGRCAAHQRAEYRRIERYRGTAKARGYDQDWRRVRDAVLRAEPCCRLCKAEGVTTLAVEVDHIVPLVEGGARLDRANLQPICHTHHAAKTADEQRRHAGRGNL